LVENFAPGVTKKLGVDHDTIKAINPKIIYASVTGYGSEGPKHNYPAFDMVIQAVSGFMSITGT
jgi:crotonobetainyl-CoA:carnitine CoA-transferase CaiB-like acyl-CoA transferase